MPASIGHNSAAYGFGMRGSTLVDAILPDDHKKLFHYAKWHLGDYITGTQGMSLEYEGAYMRFLVRLYDRGKPFPDDDRFMATVMGLSLRVWRRVRDALVAVGKIVCRNGALTNSRFERERQKRAEELRKQADAATKRWDRERAMAKTSAKLGENFGQTSLKLSSNIGEKSNEINDIPVDTHMPPRVQSPESIEEEKIQSPDGLLSSDQLALVPEDAPERKKLKAAEAARMAMERYNEIAERCGLRKALKMTPSRKTQIVARIKEAGGWTEFEKALSHLEHSAFLQGRNEKGWTADFDFLCQAKSFSRLLDGGYGNGAHADVKNRKPDDIPDHVWKIIQERRGQTT